MNTLETPGKMAEFKILGRIGEGAQGIVLKARSMNGREVALKRIFVRKLNEGKIPATVLREIRILQTSECEYIVKLLDWFVHGSAFVLVMDFMPSGLWELIHDVENPLPPGEIKTYMNMLLQGVSYLHERNIMHRDLKPSNILINADGILLIADFGLATAYSSESKTYTPQIATRWYRAPEILFGSHSYDMSVDLWAVGCIFGEMLTKAPLFPGSSDIDQLVTVLRKLGTPDERTWPELRNLPDYGKIVFRKRSGIPFHKLFPDETPNAIDLLQNFLQYNPGKRLSARMALSHHYFFLQPPAVDKENLRKPVPDHRERLRRKVKKVNPDKLFHDALEKIMKQ